MDKTDKVNNLVHLDSAKTDWVGLSSYLRQKIADQFEAQLSRCSLVEPLKSAIEYAIFPTGKCYRPLLACLICNDLKGDFDKLITVVLSLELLHCASLVHDDLPAIDNDDFRRGKPSCHKAFGEASAILAGDTMVPLAFKIICDSNFSAEAKLELQEILANAYIDLCQGQQLDLLPVKGFIELERVHLLKTGALFRASSLFGAVSVPSIKTGNKQKFAELGLKIGLLFQLIDDLLDLSKNLHLKGRDKSSDDKNHKATVVSMLNATQLEERGRSYRIELDNILEELVKNINSSSDFSGTREFLNELFTRLEEL